MMAQNVESLDSVMDCITSVQRSSSVPITPYVTKTGVCVSMVFVRAHCVCDMVSRDVCVKTIMRSVMYAVNMKGSADLPSTFQW